MLKKQPERFRMTFRQPAIRVVLVLALSLLLTMAERGWSQRKEDRPDLQNIELQGTIRVSGAWALYPMMVRWGEEFRKIHPKVRVDISAGGAGKGIADALAGLVDIGMVSRSPQKR